MIVKCTACGNDILISDGMDAGDRFVCPYCETQLAYWGRTRIEKICDVKVGIMPKILLGVLPVLVVVGLLAYKHRLNVSRIRDLRIAEERQQVDKSQSACKEERFKEKEKVAMAGAERNQRIGQQKKEEEERKTRREEMEKREAERERRRRDAQEKADTERRNRALFEDARNRFIGVTSIIAADFPDENNPLSYKTDGKFSVADMKYASEQKIYEILVEKGKLSAARLISRSDGIVEMSIDEFKKQFLGAFALVVGDTGPAWICGKVKNRINGPIPEIGSVLLPPTLFLGDSYAMVESLKVSLPGVKFRFTLHSKRKNGDIPIGVFAATESVSVEVIRSKVRERLTEQRLRRMKIGLTPPKMKKFKRTVVFYDGDKIVRTIGGITKIPMSYKKEAYRRDAVYVGDGYVMQHEDENGVMRADGLPIGTIIVRGKKNLKAHQDKVRLCEEVMRQENCEREIEAENRRAKEEYQRKVEQALRDARVTADDIDEELKKWELVIERSKSKLKNPKAER